MSPNWPWRWPVCLSSRRYRVRAVNVAGFHEWLLPGGAEKDEAFRQEILSLSHRGLIATGALETAIGVAALFGFMPLTVALAITVIGVATAASSRASSLYAH